MRAIKKNFIYSIVFALQAFTFTVMAQNVVTGKVIDAQSTSLIGVNVIEKGTSNGTITDVNGNFIIDVNSNATLIFSYIGYVSQEVQVTGGTMNIELTEDLAILEEVVVVGYGTQSKRNISGSVSDIKSEDIIRSTSVNLSGALAGKVQGITTRATDARPGKGVNLQIRNMGNPLYVIDGIPYGGITGADAFGFSQGSGEDVFNSLSTEDIESVSILKDASAAIYGLRAANGVVLVTTKKGSKREDTRVNVNGYYGFQNFTRYPQPANAYQYVRAKVESEQNYGRDPKNLYSPEEVEKWRLGTDRGYKSYDYKKIVTRQNVPQNYINVNVSGGTERSTYYLSVANTDQQALLRDFSYKRSNVQANLETNLISGLTVGTQISAILEKSHNVGVPGLDDYFNPLLSIFTMWPIESPYANDNPDYINQTHNVNVNPATYKDDVTGWIDQDNRTVNVNLYAEYKFKFGLSLKGTYSYNFRNDDFDGFEYTYDAYRYDEVNDTYYTQPGWGNQNPWREKHKRNVVNRFQQIQMSYDKKIGDHDLSAVLAYEQSDYNNSFNAFHTVPSNNYIEKMYLDELDYFADDWTVQARAGYVGRINYNFKGKYLLELIGRYDGSYLYYEDSRFGFFPGISAAWRISDENFFSSLKSTVNDLKLRASYGETGSEMGVNAFGYLSGFNFGDGNSVFDGKFVNGVRPRGLPVRNLSWVTNKTTNIGLDISLLDYKLTGSFDIFERRRSGLPAARYDVKLPSEVGYGLPNENLESDAHRGIEGLISYSDNIGEFKYKVAANASISRRRWLEAYKPRFGNSWNVYRNSSENRWTGITWGQEIIGRFQSDEEIASYPIDIDGQGNRSLLPGDFIYKDTNNDGIINGLDERPMGYQLGAQPYMSYGLSIVTGWRNWSLSADFAGATMQSYRREWELKFPFQNNGSAPHYMFEDRWHQADPFNPESAWISGEYPAIRQNLSGNHPINWQNDFWVTNVNYFRLKSLEIGYTLPKNISKVIGASNVRVYANGTNLFSLDNVSKYEIDPEIAAGNGLVYPLQKMFLFGLNLTF